MPFLTLRNIVVAIGAY